MRPANECLDVGETVEQAAARLAQSALRSWPVCDPSGVVGIVTRAQLRELDEEQTQAKKLSELLMEREFPHLHTDHSLELALVRMGETRIEFWFHNAGRDSCLAGLWL